MRRKLLSPASFLAAIVLVAIPFHAVPAAAQGTSLTVRTVSGVVLGRATEVVLDGTYTLSELDWPLLPLFTVGATVDLKTPSGLHAALEFQAGIPGLGGLMTDSDYENGDGVRTHYSQADSHNERAIFLDAHFGWSLPLAYSGARSWTLEPFVSFQFIQLKWSAQNGYLQYPTTGSPGTYPPASSDPQTLVYGTGILYQQNYYIPALGLLMDMPLLPRLIMTASVAFAPWVLAADLDNHLFRLVDFYAQNMQGGVMLEPRVTLRFLLAERAALSLDASYRHIGSPVGDSYMVGTGAPGIVYSTPLPGQTEGPYTNGEQVSLDAVSISFSLDLGL